MRTGHQSGKTADAHTGGPCARVAVGCLCNGGDHFGLEPCLFDLPKPRSQLYLSANAHRRGLFRPLDRLDNKVDQREE